MKHIGSYDNMIIRPDFLTLSEWHWELVFLTGTRENSTEIQKPLPLTGFQSSWSIPIKYTALQAS